MRAIVLLLRGFAYVWATLAVLLIVIGLIGIWMTDGFWKVQEIFSPNNIVNNLVMLAAFLPAIAAFAAARKVEKNLGGRETGAQ